MDDNLIEQKAREIHNWIQDAVGDIAYEMHPEDIVMCYGKKFKNAAFTSRDSLADQFYNDPDTLQDLCGDRLFDAATSICGTSKDPANSMHFIAIAKKMKEIAHHALATALDKLIERRMECLNKLP